MTTDELRDAILLQADTAEPGPDGPWELRRYGPTWGVETTGYKMHVGFTKAQAIGLRNLLNRDAARHQTTTDTE